MSFSKFDIFSSPFQFDFGNQVSKKDAQYQNNLKTLVKKNQKEFEQEEEKVEKNQTTFVPSFFAKSINSVDNSLFLGSSKLACQKKNQISNNIEIKESQENNQKNAKSIQECCKQNAYQQSQGLDIADKQFIESHINESLDILQMYKDLIFLKKAVLILVSKEQLAALSLIGLSSEYLKNQINQKKNCYIYDKKMSYFEEQFSILKNNELQEQYISSFFQKMFSGEVITEVDQRILNSLN
ncbi:hypothetical protein ABPG73_008830 [Tetrahymena malaccensis]